MKKDEMLSLVGKKVKVIFTDGEVVEGILAYADTFSEKNHFVKPGYFYFRNLRPNVSFRVSHTKKVVIL